MMGELLYVSERLKREAELDAKRVSDRLIRCFQGQIFRTGQDVAFEFEGNKVQASFLGRYGGEGRRAAAGGPGVAGEGDWDRVHQRREPEPD